MRVAYLICPIFYFLVSLHLSTFCHPFQHQITLSFVNPSWEFEYIRTHFPHFFHKTKLYAFAPEIKWTYSGKFWILKLAHRATSYLKMLATLLRHWPHFVIRSLLKGKSLELWYWHGICSSVLGPIFIRYQFFVRKKWNVNVRQCVIIQYPFMLHIHSEFHFNIWLPCKTQAKD